MPADLVPNEAIPELAARIHSPEMLQLLRRIQKDRFLLNAPDMDEPTLEVLRQLSEYGVIDPGYQGTSNGKPYLWVGNANGARVLRYLTESKFRFHRRASFALGQLTSNEQAQILDALADLADTPSGHWPAAQARRLAGEPPTFLVRANESLRIMIQTLPGQQPEVVDIVRHEALGLFAQATANHST